MSELNNEHYWRSVTELGDKKNIVADRDIYSKEGVKLVAAGVKISSELYERIVKHKLLLPLDSTLSVDNMLDSDKLKEDVGELFKTNERLRVILKFIEKKYLDQLICSFQIPAPLAFRLTVAREQFPRIYKHSLLLMVIGVYLAHCDLMDEQEQRYVSIAALFHDIGLLHIDPKLLEPSHMMSDSERRYLYSHPLTAYLLLREFPEFPKQVYDAVLEHHERMDGSGYPRSLSGEHISRYGQILSIGELAAKAFDSDDHPRLPWKKIEVMLKLNSRSYGYGLIGHLNIFRDTFDDEIHSNSNDPIKLAQQVHLIGQLFDNINRYAEIKQSDKIYRLVQTRLNLLKLELIEAGIDLEDTDGLIHRFTDDPDCMSEYAILLNVILWQFKSIELEISRHWPDELDEGKGKQNISENNWLLNLKQSLLTANIQY